MSTATARAYPNIALVKYWGKSDTRLMLPAAGSLSLTLDTYATTTTVELADADGFELNGAPGSEKQHDRVIRFLDLVRERAGSQERAIVRSTSEAPTDAGLASSAAGFAALAVSAAAAYGLDLDSRDLSRLARRGSGSATRSIIPGLAVWHAGTDDESSFAEAIDGPDMRMVIVTVDRRPKAVSSREAMMLTELTSPFHAAWVSSTAESLTAMREACAEGDFTRIGRIAEANALRMHAAIQAADPPIRYLNGRSIDVFDAIAGLRRDGIEAYGTADAGPNVIALTRPEDADATAAALAPLGEITVVGPGPGAQLLPARIAS